MTATELQRIALRLSNQGWCRHWLHYNHPFHPVMMAIQVRDVIKAIEIPDLIKLGFVEDPARHVYTIPRTNEDGTPYISQL